MSTNKTLKRIALVAVASLGFGLVSVAPSHAGANLFVHTADGVIANTTNTVVSGGGVAGPANTVKVSATGSVTAAGLTRIVVSGPTSATKITEATVSGISVDAGGLGATIAAAGSATTHIITIATPEVGTVTVSRFVETAAGSGIFGAATDTVTFTVAATAKTGVLDAASSKSILSDDGTPTTANTDDTLYVSAATAVATEVGIINISLVDLLGAAYKKGTVTAAVTSGPGLLSASAGTEANAADATTAVGALSGTVRTASVANTTGFVAFGVYADGTLGKSTITISVDGAVWATETLTFYGAPSTVEATLAKKQIALGVATAAVISVVVKDAAGQAVPGTPTIASATTANVTAGVCTAATATAASTCTLSGVAAGTSVITVTSATGAKTATVTVTAAAKPTAVSLAFDKATYLPGEAFTLTLTATNAAGVPGDGTYAALLAGALTTSAQLSAALFGASVTLVDGKATATGFMPVASGTFTVSGKTGADATTADVALTASATVTLSADGQAAVDAAQAAADAAAEAIDAANAATDAANLAAEAADAATVAAEEARDAADAATAAVEELATQVATLFAALRAQLTTLANTVAKIAKKVKA